MCLSNQGFLLLIHPEENSTQSRAKCFNCHKDLGADFIDVIDSRFGIPGKFRYLECKRCITAQIEPRPSQRELKNFYEIYYNSIEKIPGKNYSYYRDRLFKTPISKVFIKTEGDISYRLSTGTGNLLEIGSTPMILLRQSLL